MQPVPHDIGHSLRIIMGFVAHWPVATYAAHCGDRSMQPPAAPAPALSIGLEVPSGYQFELCESGSLVAHRRVAHSHSAAHAVAVRVAAVAAAHPGAVV